MGMVEVLIKILRIAFFVSLLAWVLVAGTRELPASPESATDIEVRFAAGDD